MTKERGGGGNPELLRDDFNRSSLPFVTMLLCKVKIEHGKSKFHEGELDDSELPAFPNSEHRAGRNYRLVKTLRCRQAIATYPLK